MTCLLKPDLAPVHQAPLPWIREREVRHLLSCVLETVENIITAEKRMACRH